MQKIVGVMRAVIEKYDMVSPGDVIGVGVSGGRPSGISCPVDLNLQR